MINVKSFCKAYESRIAVDHLSFQVDRGQVLGLIGPNGAGKTTTMRAIAGIVPFGAGTVKVSGLDVQHSPEAVKATTAYVADDPQLFNDLTVVQHFAFVANVYGVVNWQTRMDELLDRFELSARRDHKASALSRGMRQKLALGCAFLYRPSALLLDEPMTGLDPQGIRELKKTIAEHVEFGAATVVSSHLLAMVEDICSHVLILQDGARKFYGTMEQMRETFTNSQTESSLEEIFFQAVETPKPIVSLPAQTAITVPGGMGKE